MIAIAMRRIEKVKRHPVTVELRNSLIRLRITWRLHQLDRQDRAAATELAYEHARVKRMAINFEKLLADNQRRRFHLRNEIGRLNGGTHE